MRNNLLLLIFLVFTFGCPASHARQAPPESAHTGTIKAPFISIAPESSEYDDLETMLEACAAIAGIYALYWLKQQA